MLKIDLPGWKMPKSCYDCDFDHDNIGCRAIKGDEGSFWYNEEKYGFDEGTQRLPKCPLREVRTSELSCDGCLNQKFDNCSICIRNLNIADQYIGRKKDGCLYQNRIRGNHEMR